MNIKPFLLCCTLLVTACNSNKQEEKYDVITITEYQNTYDDIGRLSKVLIKENFNMYHGADRDQSVVITHYNTQHYDYKTDQEYTKTDICKELKSTIINRYTKNSAEELVLENGNDTTYYSFHRYFAKSKPEYIRIINKSIHTPEYNEDYEEQYQYDKEGNALKMLSYDFMTKEKVETYYFEGITFDEASKKIPKSANKQEVKCTIKETHKDTLITQTTNNGMLETTLKEFTKGNERIKQTFHKNMILTDSEKEEEGLKVITHQSDISGYQVDSIFNKNGRSIRSSHIEIHDSRKKLTTKKYDLNGNVIKMITKSQHSPK